MLDYSHVAAVNPARGHQERNERPFTGWKDTEKPSRKGGNLLMSPNDPFIPIADSHSIFGPMDQTSRLS